MPANPPGSFIFLPVQEMAHLLKHTEKVLGALRRE